jgi:inner membrane protein
MLWHVASAVFVFRWVFRDPKVDYRFLVAGALVPDVLDLLTGTVLVPRLATGELAAHSLLLPSLVAVIVLLATRRGRRRRAWMAFVVGWLIHLLVDGMWATAEVFFWPLFGWGFSPGEAPFWPLAWRRALADPVRWVLEAVGFAYLVVLWRRHSLGDPEVRARLAATGRLD